MLILGLLTLTFSVAASVWTTAYAVHEPVANLLWLERVRREDAWLDTIEDMHATLAALLVLDSNESEGSLT